MSNKQDELAKKILELKKEVEHIKDDDTISKNEKNAVEQLSQANWNLLQSMRCGIHFKQVFDCLGIDISLRPITTNEQIEIEDTLAGKGLIANTNGIYELERYKLTLSKASTKHPVLKQGEAPFLSLDTLGNMPVFMLRELGMHYMEFLEKCNLNILDMLDKEQIEEVLDFILKKQILWKDLPLNHRGQIMDCLIERYQTLLEQLDNLTTQS